MIQRGRGTLLEKITAACRRLDGAFAFLILTEKSLYAVRDKNGLRPLSLGKHRRRLLSVERNLRLREHRRTFYPGHRAWRNCQAFG